MRCPDLCSLRGMGHVYPHLEHWRTRPILRPRHHRTIGLGTADEDAACVVRWIGAAGRMAAYPVFWDRGAPTEIERASPATSGALHESCEKTVSTARPGASDGV
jgi:hypothetical protein